MCAPRCARRSRCRSAVASPSRRNRSCSRPVRVRVMERRLPLDCCSVIGKLRSGRDTRVGQDANASGGWQEQTGGGRCATGRRGRPVASTCPRPARPGTPPARRCSRGPTRPPARPRSAWRAAQRAGIGTPAARRDLLRFERRVFSVFSCAVPKHQADVAASPLPVASTLVFCGALTISETRSNTSVAAATQVISAWS